MGGGKIKRNFVVAHSLEARPIIDFFHLSKRKGVRGFDIYEKDDVLLVVSGQGKVNCAAAVGYCAGLSAKDNDPALWINIGIAGHKYHSIGELFRATKIIDSSSGQCNYPAHLLRRPKINGTSLMSVDLPEDQYQQDCLYDMEAYSFFSMACRIASIEYINSFKVISDNEVNPLANFNAKDVVFMIASQIGRIDEYVNKLEKNILNNINKSLQFIESNQLLFNDYHLTHSEREQVEALVNSLFIQGVKLKDDFVRPSTSNELIELLTHRLTQIQLVV